MSARNILRSQAYEALRAHFDVVLATPLHQDANFLAEFARSDVSFCDLPNGYNIFFKGYRYLLDVLEAVHFTERHKIETLDILAQALRRERPMVYWIRWCVGKALGHKALLSPLRKFQDVLLRDRYYENLLDGTRPDLVWQTHPLALEELPLGVAAKKRGIPLIGMIHSWDNITAKSGIRVVTSNRPGRMIPVRYNHMIVWNNIQKEELIRYYGYQETEISVVGVPQFDLYLTHRFSERAHFFNRIGADPSKKLILFACGSPFLLPKQDEVLQILIRMIDSGELDTSAQVLIRAHPATKMDFLRKLTQEHAGIFLQFPSPAYAASRFQSGWQTDHGDREELAESLHHCDLLINVASTMSLDAAALNRPTICIGFDGYQNNTYYHSVLKHYDFTHYLPVMKSGGIRLARSPEELREHLTAFLQDPNLDTEGRRELAQLMNPYGDGCSSERIIQVLREKI